MEPTVTPWEIWTLEELTPTVPLTMFTVVRLKVCPGLKITKDNL